MTKLDFIIRQIVKTNKKNYENYVVTGIWHRLNNLDVKMITQQYIIRNDGTYALTDMYFPQLQLHIEVDELYHQNNVDKDKIREEDIISVTNHEIIRVDISVGIDGINKKLDEIVQHVNNRIVELGVDFIPWDIEKEINPQTYIDKGYISLKDNVAFERSFDACNCFGYNYKGLQKGGAKHPIEEHTIIWFPKLYPNDEWDNSISPDGMVIKEYNIHPEKNAERIKNLEGHKYPRRIVFARVKSPLGDIMYRFKGVFQLNLELSKASGCFAFEKVADMVKTYKSV